MRITSRNVKHWGIGSAIAFFVCMVLPGCGESGNDTVAPTEESVTQATEPDADALFAEWKRAIAEPADSPNSSQHQMLATVVVSKDPEKAGDMVDLLTDPETSPESMLRILASLEVLLNPDITQQLLSLTEPDVDPAVRSGVTMLLAQAQDPVVVERFRELKEDPERRVRFAALNALMIHGDPEARAALREMYFEVDTPQPFRERIALTFGLSPEGDDVPLLADAAQREDMPEDVVAVIVAALAMSGDPAALPALAHCAEGDYADDIKAIARDGMEVIKAANSTPSDPETGTDTNSSVPPDAGSPVEPATP